MEQQIIKCAFCKETGENPYFKGTCPVCKGKGKNQVTGKYMACGDCHGSGQKRGTSLTCYTCAGLGVIPDTREELRQARQEIRKVQVEMEEEKVELTGRQPRDTSRYPSGYRKVDRKPNRRKRQMRELVNKDMEEDLQIIQASEDGRFCQACAKSTKGNDLIKVCLECFGQISKLDSR